MINASKITAIGLGLAVLIGLTQVSNQNVLVLQTGDTIVAGVANILMVYFFLALVIERGCEVAMDLLTAIGIVLPANDSADAPAQSSRKIIASLVCLVFSVFISLAGLRLAEMILNVATNSTFQPEGNFAHIDTLLTSFFLAGGSEGVHRIIRRLLPDQSSLSTNT